MYAQIQAYGLAKNAKNKYYKGKSMWVNDAGFEISLCEDSPSHLDAPPWYLEIKAQVEDDKSPGRAIIIRDLVLQLTPSDLTKLLDFANAHGLLQVSPKTISS